MKALGALTPKRPGENPASNAHNLHNSLPKGYYYLRVQILADFENSGFSGY